MLNIPQYYKEISKICSDYNYQLLRNPQNFFLSYYPNYGGEYIFNSKYIIPEPLYGLLTRLNCYYSIIDSQNMLINSWKVIIELRCVLLTNTNAIVFYYIILQWNSPRLGPISNESLFNGDRTSIYVIKSLNTELKHIVINFPYYLQYYIYLYELYYNMLYHQTNGENNRIRLSEDLLIECISIFGNNIEVFSINIY